MTDAALEKDPKTGRFLTGGKGGPGRPKGSRNKLGEAFLDDVYADWKQHGKETLEVMRQEKPAEYVKVVASILPKELNVKIDPLEELDDATLDERIGELTAAFAQLVDVQTRTACTIDGEAEEAEPEPSGELPTLQ